MAVGGNQNVRFWHKADMAIALNDVRYWGQSGHCSNGLRCPLMTQSGHELRGIAAVQKPTPGPYFSGRKSLM